MATSSKQNLKKTRGAQFQASNKIPCLFYKRGTCKFGDSCRYLHENNSTSTTSKNVDNITNQISNITFKSHEKNWADAAEFVPGNLYQPRGIESYSGTVQQDLNLTTELEPDGCADVMSQLCPYNILGKCRYEEKCLLLHGDLCEMCGLRILHPTDEEQRKKHIDECVSIHEEDMKESFQLAKNQDISCGICMEKIVEKACEKDRKFGILENCNHAFCLSCIRKWRQAKSFKSSVVKSCPECRISSAFVTPSDNWVEDKEEKEALIKGYKEHLANKPCMHFKKGKGRCPFGVKCFYLHAYEDGTKQDRSKPQKTVRNADGDMHDIDPASLWEFFMDHDNSSPFDIDIEETLEWIDFINNFGSDFSGDYVSDDFDWFNSDFDSDSDSDFIF